MTDLDTEFTAVQEDPGSFSMDWPVIEQEDLQGRASGTVFVLDRQGERVTSVSLDARLQEVLPHPGRLDEVADGALRAIGWDRSGPWVPDGFGRHSASVVAVAPSEPIPAQSRHGSPSLADEASLYLS